MDATSVGREDVRQSVTGRMEPSSTDPFMQSRLVRLFSGTAVSVRRRSTDVKGLSKTVGINKHRSPLSRTVEKSAQRFVGPKLIGTISY